MTQILADKNAETLCACVCVCVRVYCRATLEVGASWELYHAYPPTAKHLLYSWMINSNWIWGSFMICDSMTDCAREENVFTRHEKWTASRLASEGKTWRTNLFVATPHEFNQYCLRIQRSRIMTDTLATKQETENVDILLTVHLNIFYLSNQPTWCIKFYNEFISCLYMFRPPRWCLHLIVVRGFEYVSDPESYTSGSIATGRASLAGQVKG